MMATRREEGNSRFGVRDHFIMALIERERTRESRPAVDWRRMIPPSEIGTVERADITHAVSRSHFLTKERQ